MSDAAATSTASVPENRINAALLGIVAALAATNAVILWTMPEDIPEVALSLYFGYTIFQPVIFGAWTALGAGSIFTRLPMATACLILLWVSPGSIPPNFNKAEKYEFILFAAAGLALHLIALALFLLFRRVSGFRLQSALEAPRPPVQGLQFSTRFILCLMSILAFDLGMAFNLRFQPPPDPGTIIFGPGFFIMILLVYGAALGAAILPTIAAPLFILHGQPSRRAVKRSLLFYVVVSLSLTIFFFDQFEPGGSFVVLFLPQLASTMAGVIIAFVLRRVGMRLVHVVKNPQTPVPSAQSLR